MKCWCSLLCRYFYFSPGNLRLYPAKSKHFGISSICSSINEEKTGADQNLIVMSVLVSIGADQMVKTTKL